MNIPPRVLLVSYNQRYQLLRRKLLAVPQSVWTLKTIATSQGIFCQQPSWLCRIGHIYTTAEHFKPWAIRQNHDQLVFKTYTWLPVSSTTALQVALTFVHISVMSYGTSSFFDWVAPLEVPLRAPVSYANGPAYGVLKENNSCTTPSICKWTPK